MLLVACARVAKQDVHVNSNGHALDLTRQPSALQS